MAPPICPGRILGQGWSQAGGTGAANSGPDEAILGNQGMNPAARPPSAAQGAPSAASPPGDSPLHQAHLVALVMGLTPMTGLSLRLTQTEAWAGVGG